MTTKVNILKQYEGFLNTPQLFKSTTTLDANIFETNEVVDLNAIKHLNTDLSKQKYLGKRAELFLLQYLKSSSRYDKVTHSFQIQNETKTLGELDILCYDNAQQQWIHIELVYKFYVYIGEDHSSNLTQWIGPNLKDRLDYKIDKLKSHQLPLGQDEQVLEKIETKNLKTYCCYKAKLFLKSTDNKLNTNIINKDCIAGRYLNFEEFKVLKHDHTFYYVPEKQDWVCNAHDNKKWYDFEKTEIIIKSSIKEKRAKLVWLKDKADKIRECFVVWW